MLATTLPVERSAVTQSHQDDAGALLAAVANGDRKAYERLFRRFHDKVYRFVFRMLKDADLADEVSSDTLFTVWTDAARFRGRSSVSSWVFGIAYRKSLKALRTRKRLARLHEPIGDVETLSGDIDFDDPKRRLAARLEMNVVNEGIERLSGDHQAVVRLTALGHSTREIADIVGCPRNTVKTRMFHARIRLRTILGMDDASSAFEHGSK